MQECHVRKIDAMLFYYGRALSGRCGECPHLLEGEYHGRKYFKCTVYGLSHSEATDWRKSYLACGLINKPFPEGETRVKDRITRGNVQVVLDGQIEMDLEG